MTVSGHRDAAQIPAVDPDLTEAIEHGDVYRDRCQRVATENAELEKRLDAAYHDAISKIDQIEELRDALRKMIARIRRIGGYATPDEQDDLRYAERVLKGRTT